MNLRWLIAALVCAACGTSPGSRDEGDACECRSDCRSDLYCADASGHLVEESEHGALGGYCPGEGTCIPRRAAGESCGDGVACAQGLLCLAATQVCDVAQPEGASCGAASDCQEELFCNLTLEAPVCASPGAAGAACGDTSQCLAGLTCNTGYEPGRCEEPLAGAESDPCSDDTHCGMNLLCYNAGYCEAVGSDGATYHPSPSTCTPAGTIEAGAPCQQDDNCISRHCIESQTGICTNHNCA